MKDTKRLIGQKYKELVLEHRGSEVSVREISSACGISRKAFYYHFEDRSGLAKWVFRSELGDGLHRAFDKKQLVYPLAKSNDPLPDIPYYARLANGVRSLDQSAFFKLFGEYLQVNRSFYRYLLRDTPAHGLRRYLSNLYRQASYGDISYILGGRVLPEDVMAKLVNFHAHASFMHFFDAIQYSDDSLSTLLPPQFENINHELLSLLVESYFTRREQEYPFFRV